MTKARLREIITEELIERYLIQRELWDEPAERVNEDVDPQSRVTASRRSV